MSTFTTEQHSPVGERPLQGHRVAIVTASCFDSDPRPRRAAYAMAEAGMRLDVFCLAGQHATSNPPEHDFIKVNRLHLTRKRSGILRYILEYVVFFMWAFIRLTFGCLRGRYDIVHVHNMPDFLVFTAFVPKLLGARVILDLHDPTPEVFETVFKLPREHARVRLMTVVERVSVRFADAVLTPNISFKKLFERTGYGEKIHIIMNSPDEDIFTPSRRNGSSGSSSTAPAKRSQNGRLRLMYHGLIAERHGLHILVDAMARLAKDIPGARLDIYGDPPNGYLDSILARAQEKGMRDRIRYHGFKSLEDIARLIGKIDLGIIPNLPGPFTDINLPTRIFEYLAVGKPVIAPRTRGIQDYFGENDIIFFEPGDSEDLAIRDAHNYPALVETVIERGGAIYKLHRWSEERRRLLDIVS